MPQRDNTKQKSGTTPPPVDPNSAFGFGAQLQELLRQFRQTESNLRVQKGQLYGDFGTQRAAIGQAKQQGMLSAINNAAERGVVASSGDVMARVDVEGNAATQLAQARSGLLSGLLANRAQAQDALTQLRVGVINLNAQKAAQQALQNAQDFVNNTFNTPSGGGGGGGPQLPPAPGGPGPGPGPGGDGGGGLTPAEQAALERDRQQLLAQIQAYAGMNNAQQRAALLDQIHQLWSARNRTRVDLGLKRVPWKRLKVLIQQATQDNNGPHGQQ